MRAGRAKRKVERARVGEIELVNSYSALKTMGNEQLKDQLKAYKMRGQTGFVVTQKDRAAYVLQVQSLMSEALGPAANDLKDGDSGVAGRGVRLRAADQGKPTEAKSRRHVVHLNGYSWYNTVQLLGKLLPSLLDKGLVTCSVATKWSATRPATRLFSK